MPRLLVFHQSVCVCLAIVVSALCVDASSSAALRWSALMRLQPFDVTPPLRLADFADTGRGVATTRTLTPNSVVFRAPTTLALSAHDANATAHGAAAALQCAFQPRCRPDVAALIAHVLYERSAGNASIRFPFFDHLPLSYETHLVHFGILERVSPYMDLYALFLSLLSPHTCSDRLSHLDHGLINSLCSLLRFAFAAH